MKWAAELGLQQICFELDAQKVAEAANGDYHKVCWENQQLILDIIESLRNHPLWSCKYLNRRSNKRADKLAKYARSFKVSKDWNSNPPGFITSSEKEKKEIEF